jgi:hypothetical protein
LEQILSLRSQLETAADPIEQRDAQIVLKSVDLPGSGWLSHIQPSGGRRYSTTVCDRHESAEVSKVHCSNIQISY